MSSLENFDHQTISKINQFIYLGSYEPILNENDEFEKLKFDVLINCSEIAYPIKIKNQYIVHQYPLSDDQYATLLEYIDEASEKINEYVNLGKKIYIHCVHGMSRSPAILIYYLMQYKKFTFNSALDLITAIRPIVSLNPNFTNELYQLE